jgi:AcrR family transcriptional regulator
VPYKKSVISASQIVAAATRVLARKGYGRTSLNEIAKEAGMSKGAVHYHFPTKEALVGTVLETVCDAVAERTRAAWAQAEANPFAALRAAILELWDVRTNPTDEVKVIADLLAQSLHDDGLRPPLAAYYRFASMQTVEHLRGWLVSTAFDRGSRTRWSRVFCWASSTAWCSRISWSRARWTPRRWRRRSS